MSDVTDPRSQQWLTTTQVARELGLSESRIRQLAESGKLVCRRTPLGRLFDVESVISFAEERESS